MKIALIFLVISVIFDSVKTRSSDITMEARTEQKNVKNTAVREKTEISPAIKQNVTSSPISSHHIAKELKIKNRLMPKIDIKDISAENNNSPYISTTRRPLMRNQKFTSKPHAVHYIHSRTQTNFSKRRNLNAKNRLKSQIKNENTLNTALNSESGEDRFINFTDIGAMDEVRQTKRKVSKQRPLNRRRGYPLATAASQQFKSIAINTLLNTDKVRSKSKLAILESLEKIRRIRPGLKEKAITSRDSVSTKIKNNMSSITTQDTEKNKIITVTTSKKSISPVNTTEKPIYFAKVEESLANLETTTEILNDSVTITQKNITSITNIETLHSKNKTDTPFYSMKIENKDDSQIKEKKAEVVANTVDKLFDNKTEKLLNSATTNGNVNNTEQWIHFITATEQFHGSVNKTVKPIHPTEIIKGPENLVSETITSEPLIIVTSKTISLFGMNDTVKAVNDSIFTLEEVNLNKLTEVKELITVTPIPNEDEVTTPETIIQDIVFRRKRRINIIEEERVPTTSTGFRFSGRETPIGIDFTYRNIHA
ncbi:jg9882 [Pararge aegeria aegeria]|uniref:Jg9882 protein n=1 Tax=Pararge aegeria aegeria TaxID=348720 RepID=A0A8S4RFV9_9NEOP|nr:jg9882 [Pararge aegeria aegeria]